jgi:hypothetical protein
MCIWALGRYQHVGADSGKEIDTYRLGVDSYRAGRTDFLAIVNSIARTRVLRTRHGAADWSRDGYRPFGLGASRTQ